MEYGRKGEREGGKEVEGGGWKKEGVRSDGEGCHLPAAAERLTRAASAVIKTCSSSTSTARVPVRNEHE